MKILRRYLCKEILTSCFAVLLILWAVLMTARLAHFLGAVAEGRIPADVLLELLALKSVGYLVALFPVATFIGALLALGRLYRDNEAAVMFGCGVQPSFFYRAMMSLIIPSTLVLAIVSIWVTPWTENQAGILKKTAAASAIFKNLNEGRFNTFNEKNAMLYVERMSDDKQTLHNVVYKTLREDNFVLLTAPTAYHVTDERTGDHYLSLEQGFRYEGKVGEAAWLVAKFVRHGIVLQEPVFEGEITKLKALPVIDLIGKDGAHTAELHRRLSMPIAVFLMGLLAVALGRSAPREGKYGRLFTGILIYVIYANILTTTEMWLSRGLVPAAAGMWWVHAMMFFLWYYINRKAFGNFKLKRATT